MSRAPSSTAESIAIGAAAGLVAGLAASFAMNRFQALTQPSADDDGEPATQKAADAIARGLTGASLPEASKPLGGQFVHYGLGAVLGGGYGIAAEFAPVVTWGAGTAFAAAIWTLLDETVVPAAGLGDPPWKSPPTTQVYSFASHLVFGLAAEAIRRLARGVIVRRAPFFRLGDTAAP